ncbi:MAG: glycosyltransferase family 4 protein [Chlorobium sp.]
MIFDATPNWSGGSNRVLLFSKELKKRGHTLVVCCLPFSGLSQRLPEEGITTYTVDPKADVNFFIIPELIRIIGKEQIELIEICSPKFYWIASLAGKVTGKKVILTRNVPYRKKGVKKQINRLLYSILIDGVIAVSDKIKRELLEDYSLCENKISVIYDGIDLTLFSDQQQKEADRLVHKVTCVIAVISRLDANKGLECFIKAIPHILEKSRSAQFLIVGTGALETQLKELASTLNISDKLLFTGFRHDIPEILAEVDITVMPSPAEGMSMSALESMASGRPVVATSGSGLVDVIVNNVSGIIVKPDDSKELAEGVVKLLHSDYREIGRAARKIVEEKFALQQVVSQYEQLAKEFIDH